MSFNQNEKDLTLLYDEDFNIKYDIVSKMNKAISAKSKVIEITDTENHNQRKKIKLLNLILTMISFMILAVILYSINIIKKRLLNAIIILLVFGYIIKIITVVYNNPANFDYENTITRSSFGHLDSNGMAPVPVPPPKCPSQCSKHTHKQGCIKPIKQKMTANLKTDSSLNQWVYGDQPEATFYNPRIYNTTIPNLRTTEAEIEQNEPQKSFPELENNTKSDKPVKGITYYDCAKLLENKVSMRSNIPCSYYPDHKTISKCIYTDSGECEKV